MTEGNRKSTAHNTSVYLSEVVGRKTRKKPTAALWLFLGIFVQKIFETNPNFRYQVCETPKKLKAQVLIQLLKLTKQTCLYSTKLCTLWYLKLRFVSNTFWTKIPKCSQLLLAASLTIVTSIKTARHIRLSLLLTS